MTRDYSGSVFTVTQVTGGAHSQSAKLDGFGRIENDQSQCTAGKPRQQKPKMPLITNTAVLKVFATLPLATYQAGETVLAAGTTTGRLLILRRGAVTIEKEGTEIAEVAEPGAIFGELSALLHQPHTADVRTLENSEFHVGRAELLEQDPMMLSCVAAILAQRLNIANQALIKLRSEIQLHRIVGRTIGKAVKILEEQLSASA